MALRQKRYNSNFDTVRKYLFRLTVIVLLVSYSKLDAQSAHKLLRQGDHAYKQEQFDLAEESYRKALEKESSSNGTYNLGNTVYQQDRFEEAVQHYQQSVNAIGSEIERSEALYNLGNAQLQNGQLEEAIISYKEAVRLNPEDDDVRQNLYLVKLMRKEQQEQQQEQQQENQQDQENSDDQQEQKEQQQQQGESQEEEQQASSADIDNEGGESSEPQEAQELSKEDAEKLLQVIENEEKNVQEKLRKISGNKKKPKKDW